MSKRIKYPSIPSHVRVTAKRTYEVVHIEEFKGQFLGECRFDPPQIVLKKGQTPKEEFSTFIHELCHAISEEYKVGLTEKQVLALEKGLLNFLKLNGHI